MRVLEIAGVVLAVDEFGQKDDPPVLLISGATQSMDWWTPDFCSALAARDLRVIRFNQRDTGQSETSPPGSPSYSGEELATDPLLVLEALGLDAAHLVGLSMGGGIAQYLAVRAPVRVKTLTLVESSPVGGHPGDLPPPEERLHIAENTLPQVHDWTDLQAVIEYRIEAERPYAGPLGLDEDRLRAIAGTEAERR